jgi:hypothetical protein
MPFGYAPSPGRVNGFFNASAPFCTAAADAYLNPMTQEGDRMRGRDYCALRLRGVDSFRGSTNPRRDPPGFVYLSRPCATGMRENAADDQADAGEKTKDARQHEHDGENEGNSQQCTVT